MFMSAMTTSKPGYKGRIDAWDWPSYDEAINRRGYTAHAGAYHFHRLYADDFCTEADDEEYQVSDLETAASDWWAYVEEDTNDC